MNRLNDQKSPYLLQHASNPVNWYPWCEEAFHKAKSEQKLILISIGYATCHWCHVMERESFEDKETAEYLNRHFVSIKVDREERPDIDQVFMDALHALGEQGGWPLNMFATPNGRPFTGGTYFPPIPMYGRQSFRQVLESLQYHWHKDRGKIHGTAEQLLAYLKRVPAPQPMDELPPEWDCVEKTVQAYRQVFDNENGGFALQRPNKFPPSMGLQLLLRYYLRTGNPSDLFMVELTLEKMRNGGIYDQVGGGLCRYSTDYRWLVPHFEKMLYDNALFAQAALECFQVTKNSFYLEIVKDILHYIKRDMFVEGGGFCSAEDADSEGHEGLFYLWSADEFKKTLEENYADKFAEYWNVTDQGNFEDKNILTVEVSSKTLKESWGLDETEWLEILSSARSKLLHVRSQRIRPFKDDKVLVSWNALMISSFAQAAKVLDQREYGKIATNALSFIQENLINQEGRLLRRYRDGEAKFPAYLCDYALLGLACLDIYAWNYEPQYILQAHHWANEINRLFINPDGAYFETGVDAEEILVRKADGHDGVEPSGNTSTAMLFLKLSSYGMGSRFLSDAERIFHSFSAHLHQAGVNFSAMLNALIWARKGGVEVIVTGDESTSETKEVLLWLRQSYLPEVIVAFIPSDDPDPVTHQIPITVGKASTDSQLVIYICQGQLCQAPVNDLSSLKKLIKQILKY
jgi:uncharacterized protein YyaL (SSP411 family)